MVSREKWVRSNFSATCKIHMIQTELDFLYNQDAYSTISTLHSIFIVVVEDKEWDTAWSRNRAVCLITQPWDQRRAWQLVAELSHLLQY